NEFEQWVRTGFWGNSDRYWDIQRPSLSQRLFDAEKISAENTNDSQKTRIFFEKEMEGFYNLVWGIGIDTTLANQYQLKVYCPAFKDRSSVDKLTVEI
ncbi:hypothetical protein HYE62_00065, partial [Aggregatibacter actinomycetemcomitans]|nr:hypothetical protein [Aggregatibacter actinomycetemcomitans]MBN6082646.1 hypothetical protein [Aggregatibacter actinomycetemcomitans]